MNSRKCPPFNKFFWLMAVSLFCFIPRAEAQTAKEKVEQYSALVDAYGRASRMITKGDQVQEGIEKISSLIKQCEGLPDYQTDLLPSFYRTRSLGYLKLKKYENSANDANKSVELLRRAGDSGKADLCSSLYCLSLAYYYMDKREEAMETADEHIKTAISHYGLWHSETISAYDLRSNFAGFYNLKDIALADRKAIFEIIKKNVERNFTYLTSDERSAYWNKQLPATALLLTFAHKMGEEQSTYTDALFDQQLLAKGLLLTAESSLQRVIDNDPILRSDYQKIRLLRTKVAEGKLSASEAEATTLEADRLERSLGTSASALYQFLDFLKVRESDVRKKLSPTDVAIEFVDYRIGKDSTMYAALIMSPSLEHVRFLPLAESKEIAAHSDNLTSLIWTPILDVVGKDIRNIYFSPTGLLYQIPIESHVLLNNDGKSNTHKYYRMSSTRWLALDDSQSDASDAVIYGGLTYDASIEELQEDAKKYVSVKRSTSPVVRGALTELKYLPGTRVEAQAVASEINRKGHFGLHADLLLGKQGTEASFKNLDGKRKRIVHIATHGFYVQGGQSDYDIQEQCGLYFAGADNKKAGEEIPQDIEDGILSAKEISELDLKGLNLIALSACQTGEGEITADGVFGLQRGFKKAGAQSILMSLWDVDDEATCLLMTEFYRHWLGGESKHDALEKAKQEVRTHKEKGWDDPRYWAAFILLDGLD